MTGTTSATPTQLAASAVGKTHSGTRPAARLDMSVPQWDVVHSIQTFAATPAYQNLDAVRQTADHFLREQTTGLPGKVSIILGEVVSEKMPACSALEAFLPPGTRLWGTTTVGVRCVGERPWTLYLQARINVTATYLSRHALSVVIPLVIQI